MKKFLFGTLAAAALVFTSCSQEDFQMSQTGDEATVSVTLTTPQLAGRAYSDGTTATKLQYAVYEKTGTDAAPVYRRLDKYTVTNDEIHISTKKNFRLVNGHTYTFVFWAAAPQADTQYGVTFGDAGAQMKINYASKANDETLDAFFVCEDVKVTGDVQKTFELRRPFAQLNVGTNDFQEAAEVGYVPYSSRIIVTGIYDTLDLITGDVLGTSAQRTFAYNVIPTTEKFPVDGYDYLAMAYVLAPEKEKALSTVQFAYAPSGGTAETRQVGSVPLQRNYRTNLFGQVLTSNAEINIIIEPDYYDPDYKMDELVMAAALGGTITLDKNVTTTQDVVFRKDGIVNLNDQTWNVDNSTISITAGANVVINGEGNITKTGADSFGSTAAVYVNNANSTVTINGGNITSDGYEAVYVQVGTAYITGGYFAAAKTYPDKGKYYTLNCNDTNFKNKTAKIIVTGGIFENFNPAASEGDYNEDGTPANFVADGYKSVPVTINGKDCYMVVPVSVDAVASTPEEARDALAEGKDVVLVNNMEVEAVVGYYGKTKAGFWVKGNQVLDGAGNTFKVNNAYGTYDCNVHLSSGTLKNITLIGGAERGITVNFNDANGSGEVYLENVKIPYEADILYGINVNETTYGKSFYAKDCLFTGWCSWGYGENLVFTFENCEFGLGMYNKNDVSGRLVKPHGTTVFKNCTFLPNTYFDLSDFNAKATLVFDNCTINGVKLTKENHKDLMKGYLEEGLDDWEGWAAAESRVTFK